jgi:hypothetical protein
MELKINYHIRYMTVSTPVSEVKSVKGHSHSATGEEVGYLI